MKFGTFAGGWYKNRSSITLDVTIQAICAVGATDSYAVATKRRDLARFASRARIAEAQAK